MNDRMRRLGQMVAAVAIMATIGLGALPASEAMAVAISYAKDVRAVSVKVANFSADCKALGGTASTRPSANDNGTTIANCKGGGMGGTACAYSPKDSYCTS